MSLNVRHIWLLCIVIVSSFFVLPQNVSAGWLYSSKTGSWINLGKKIKATPKEQFDYAKSLEEKKEYKDALKEYDKFLYNFSNSPLVAEVHFRIGMCYEQLGQYYKAYKIYQKIIEKHISYENIRDVIEKQYKIGNLFMGGERKKIFGFIPTLISPVRIAERIYEGIVKSAPYSEYAVKAVYKLGEIKIKNKNYKDATDIYKKIIADYNNPEYTEAATFKIAYCKYMLSKDAGYEQKSTLKAMKFMMNFLKEYKDSKFKKEAVAKVKELKERYAKSHWDKAVFYKEKNKIDAALIYFNAIVEECSGTDYAKKALIKINNLKQNIDKEQEDD